MKINVYIEDDVEASDFILIGRAMRYLRSNQPEGLGGLTYYPSTISISYKKNKSSYSMWVYNEVSH